MSEFGGNGVPPIPASYYENFLESLAQIVSKLLTDRETEAVLASIRSFQEKLRRLSNIAVEISNASNWRLQLLKKNSLVYAVMSGKLAHKTVQEDLLRPSVLPLLPAILKQMAGRKSQDSESDRLNAFVAGCVAGSALIFDSDKRRRQSVMLYLFTRALQFNGAWLMKKWSHERNLRHPGKVKWDDHLAKFAQSSSGVAVMMIANAQLIYAFLFNHDTLPHSYFSFLLTHGGFKKNFGRMAAPVAEAVGLTVHQIAEDQSPITIPYDMDTREFYLQNVSPNIGNLIRPRLHHKYILCAIQHPLHDACVGDKMSLFGDELLRSAKLYIPLNIIMLIVFRSKQLMLE
ncbi:hypothetical protein G6F56_008255 [Rhizopus delemar]|nr:hypothetical protein G6F56_008255 [Rhizopus delemar]